MSKTPKPCDSDLIRCIALRKQSKRGFNLREEDHEFCEKMWKKYPKWYQNTEARIFNETVPYGSKAHIKEPED